VNEQQWSTDLLLLIIGQPEKKRKEKRKQRKKSPKSSGNLESVHSMTVIFLF